MKRKSVKRKNLFLLLGLSNALTFVLAALFMTIANSYTVNLMTSVIDPAIISAVSTAIPIYIGVVIGIPSEIDAALEKIGQKVDANPTAARLKKVLELSDKLFGDEQAVEQITAFFKEARALVGSPEAKNLLKNMTDLVKAFSTMTEKPKNIPALPEPDPATAEQKISLD